MTDSMQGLKKKKLKNLENKAENSKGQSSSTLLLRSGDVRLKTILSLNDDIFTIIFSYLSYDEIAKLRLV